MNFRIIKHLVPIAVGLSFIAAALPAQASTLTSAQVSAIVSLLQSFGADSSTIANVQASLGVSSSGTSSSGIACACPASTNGAYPPVPCSCPALCGTTMPISYNLTVGATDAATGGQVSQLQQFLGVSSTGYFGPLTHSAVVSWQSSQGLPATGYVGSLTRSALASHWCNPNPQPTASLSADPSYGAVPLTVNFTGGGLTGGNQYVIDYGDGANSGPLSAINICMGTIGNPAGCPRVSGSHTYTSAGTYTAELEPYVSCMWSNPRCMIAVIPLAKTTVVVGGGASSGGAPTISGLDAPASLAVGQTGTWVVHTSVPNLPSANLHYSVQWGDENYPATAYSSAAASMQTSATFTHTYAQPGTYTPTFTVTNDAGQSAQTSASVVVGGSGLPAPVISSISPSAGPIGTSITIVGVGFTADNTVHFGIGGAVHVPSYNNGTILYFTIPSSVGPCSWVGNTSPIQCFAAAEQVQPGSYQMYVSNTSGSSNTLTFTVTQ